MLRDVRAEVPRRIPPGVCAEASPETAFSKWEFGSTNGAGHAKKARTIDGDAKKVTHFLNLATGQSKRSEVPKNEVVVGTAGLELVPTLDEVAGESSGVGDDLTCVLLPLGLGNLEECCRDGSDRLQGTYITIK